MHALLLLTVLTLSAPARAPQATSPGTDDPAAEAFLAWAAETAIPLDLDQPVPVEVLAPLVGDKRFVFLGEPDHYIQEKYAFRLAFLRTLHALGWRHLGMEMGRSDGIRLDRYLEGGNERDLLAVGLYSGAGGATATGAGGFLAMELEYARGLRALAPGPQRMHYFGFDLDMRPGQGIEDARARLAGMEEAEELALVLDEVWGNGRREQELALLLEELREPDSPLAAPLPPEALRELVLDLGCLLESLVFQRTASPFATSPRDELSPDEWLEASLAGFARRERAMFRSLDGMLEALGAREGIVLTGHNMHLGRSSQGASWIELDSTFPVPLWPTIGAYITERHPGQVFCVWLLYDHGAHLNGTGFARRELDSVPGTLESLLAQLPHETLLLPLASDDPRSAWLDDEHTFRVNGGVGRGRLRELADALVFVRAVEPPRATE